MEFAMINSRQVGFAALALMASLWGVSSAAVVTPDTSGVSEGSPPIRSASPNAPNGNTDADPPKDEPTEHSSETRLQTQLNDVHDRLKALEARKLGSSFYIGEISISPIWPAAAGVLAGLLGVFIGIGAQKQLRRSHGSLRHQADALRTRLSALEIQVEQDRVLNRSRSSPQAPAQDFQPLPTPPQSVELITPMPPPQPVETLIQNPPQSLFSKAGLIEALNNGNRQQLRDAAKAELNITNESENAIAIGRTVATDLEEVPGGGSYWLICLDSQHWLFPTDRTLKGFTAAQPSKGLFAYEQSLIANAQLIEPALLEQAGSLWCVKALGLIRTP